MGRIHVEKALHERYGERFHAVTYRDRIDLVPIEPSGDDQLVLRAATYQDEDGATAFVAFHAAIAEERGGRICSSDGVYDELDLDRFPLEDLPD